MPDDDAFPPEIRASLVAARLHVLEGFISAHSQWEAIGRTVWSCRTSDEALVRLIAEPFRFSEEQAQHILDVPLRRQTHEQLALLEAERRQLAEGT